MRVADRGARALHVRTGAIHSRFSLFLRLMYGCFATVLWLIWVSLRRFCNCFAAVWRLIWGDFERTEQQWPIRHRWRRRNVGWRSLTTSTVLYQQNQDFLLRKWWFYHTKGDDRIQEEPKINSFFDNGHGIVQVRFPTVFRPFSDRFPTVFRLFLAYLLTVFRPFSDYLLTVFRPFSD